MPSTILPELAESPILPVLPDDAVTLIIHFLCSDPNTPFEVALMWAFLSRFCHAALKTEPFFGRAELYMFILREYNLERLCNQLHLGGFPANPHNPYTPTPPAKHEVTIGFTYAVMDRFLCLLEKPAQTYGDWEDETDSRQVLTPGGPLPLTLVEADLCMIKFGREKTEQMLFKGRGNQDALPGMWRKYREGSHQQKGFLKNYGLHEMSFT